MKERMKRAGTGDVTRVRVPVSTDEWQDMKDLEFEPEVVEESLDQAIGDEPHRRPGTRKRRAAIPEIATEELEQAVGDEPLKIGR